MDLILQIGENERTAQDWLLLGNILEDKGEKDNANFRDMRIRSSPPPRSGLQ